jgi:cytochrome P450
MDPETARNPQPMYRALREAGPVADLGPQGVLVTRRVDIEEVFRHPEVFSSDKSAAELGNVRPLIPLQVDPPEHRKFRKLLDPLFAPPRMKELEEPVARLVNRHIDAFAGEDRIDFVARFSQPFPSEVFLTMLGLPLDEVPRFLAMKDGIIRPHELLGKPMFHPDVAAHREQVAASIYAYFEDVLDERQEQPRDDLVSRFLTAEVDGERLTREDILDICFLFFIAGLDTVSASLDCMFAYLAEHPDRRRQLVADPTLVAHAVEELLRWETPVIAVPRVAARDTELAGCPVAAGQHVMVLIGSANTDETDLADADAVRWDREVNRHLAFGGGIHRCLGSHLARMELRIALREWHARIPDYAVAPDAELRFSTGIRSLETFPMVLGRSA